MVDPTNSVDTTIGILLALLAAAMFSVGAIMQKKGVQDIPDIKLSDMDTVKPMLQNRTWVIGTAIGLAGGLPYIASQGFIGIGFTQLLLATGLIFLVFFANHWLGEKLGIFEWAGIASIAGGTIFLGIAQLSDVGVTLTSPGLVFNSVLFYIIFGIIIAVGLIIYKLTDLAAGKNMAILSGIFFGVGAFSSQIGVLGLEAGNWLVMIIGFFTLIIGNAVGTLVVNIAFQKGKAVMVIPLQSAGNYLIPVFAGLLIFQQTFTNAAFFWPAVIVIMVGVVLLSRIQAEMEESKPETTSSKDLITSTNNQE